jgi:putative transposase
LKAKKLSQAEIARQLGVSRATVSDWAQRMAKGGLRSLRNKKVPGRTSKLNQVQKQKLKKLLDRGALAAGFPTDRWTLERVVKLVENEFSIEYHPKYMGQFLKKLGYSTQRPLPRAQEGDEVLSKAWLKKDWIRIKKVATARRTDRVLG